MSSNAVKWGGVAGVAAAVLLILSAVLNQLIPAEGIVDVAFGEARPRCRTGQRQPIELAEFGGVGFVVGDLHPLHEVLRTDIFARRRAAEESRSDRHGGSEKRVEARRAGAVSDIDDNAQHVERGTVAQK